MYIMLVILLVGLGLLMYFNLRANQDQQAAIQAAEEAEAATPTPAPTATPEPTAVPQRNASTVTLAFAGDLVGQAGLATDAQTTADDGTEAYDFTDELSGVRASLENADLAACTLVSTVTDSGEYDSYRMPSAIGTGLRDAGFDLVNAASDHIMDRGLEGLTETVNHLKNSGLGVIGAYDSSNRSFLVATVGGVKVAFLSYTYGTAGTGADPVSIADNSWCLDILTTDYMTEKETVDYEKIDADIAAVQQSGADIVVCYVYWWDNTQYYTEPRDNQKEVVDHLLDKGVDIVIGGGVKVPQPIEVRTVEREDGTKANCVVCYSLSSMMSCFNDEYTNISAVASIQISRDTDNGDVWISAVNERPLMMVDTDDYTDYGNPGFKYRLVDARNAMEGRVQGTSYDLSDTAYSAAEKAIGDLQTLLGAEYDVANGGKSMEFPY